MTNQNPLLIPSGLTHNAPAFGHIKDEHFLPAFDVAIADYAAKAAAIAEDTAPPTFENTLYALEEAQVMLNNVASIFFALSGSDMTDARQGIMDAVLPKLQEVNNGVFQNASLFARVEAVAALPCLDTEQKRLADDYIKGFVQAGIRLSEEEMQKVADINAELATLSSKFSQEGLKQMDADALVVDTAKDLAGLGDDTLKQLAKDAEDAGQKGKYLIKPAHATAHPFLAKLENRATRERLYKASIARGQGESQQLAKRMLELRGQKAKLLGYANWAEKQLVEQTAKSVDNVFGFVAQMAPQLKTKTDNLAAEMAALMKLDGHEGDLKPWDWHYYAKKLQQQQSALDADDLKPYFLFENVLERGVFFTMEKLYGIRIHKRPDLPVYHKDVMAYEVFDANGSSLAIFYGDFFARPGKRGGAWKTDYVKQFLANGQRPVVVNVCNITKADGGDSTFITLSEAQTLFHEFGHALHEIFSRTRYSSNSGTSVPTDYVEFPSTYHEDWAHHPDVLQNYAHHNETGEVLPQKMVQQLLENLNFSQAFITFEYLAAAVLDLELHTSEAVPSSLDDFEQTALKRHGLDSAYIYPRYRAGYFSHIFAGGYSAGYYAYIWSEILAADAYAYTQEQGGLSAKAGMAYRDGILALGDSIDPTQAYEAYRGQPANADALLKRRGLA